MAERPPLRRGADVKIVGLKSQPLLNGLLGTVLDLDVATGRWQIDIGEALGGVKALKRDNLLLPEEQDKEDDEEYIPGDSIRRLLFESSAGERKNDDYELPPDMRASAWKEEGNPNFVPAEEEKAKPRNESKETKDQQAHEEKSKEPQVEEDYTKLSVKELKLKLSAKGVNMVGVTEKAELVELCKKAARLPVRPPQAEAAQQQPPPAASPQQDSQAWNAPGGDQWGANQQWQWNAAAGSWGANAAWNAAGAPKFPPDPPQSHYGGTWGAPPPPPQPSYHTLPTQGPSWGPSGPPPRPQAAPGWGGRPNLPFGSSWAPPPAPSAPGFTAGSGGPSNGSSSRQGSNATPQGSPNDAAKSSQSGSSNFTAPRSFEETMTRVMSAGSSNFTAPRSFEEAMARVEERLKFRRPKENTLSSIERFKKEFGLSDELELGLKLLTDDQVRCIVTPNTPFSQKLKTEPDAILAVVQEIGRTDPEVESLVRALMSNGRDSRRSDDANKQRRSRSDRKNRRRRRDEEEVSSSRNPKRSKDTRDKASDGGGAQGPLKAKKAAEGDGDPITKWVMELDSGRGGMMRYADKIREEFGDLDTLASSLLPEPTTSSVVGWVDPSLWTALACDALGHRLLIAKGIVALGKK